MRTLDAQLYPEKLKAIAQQVQDQQSLGQLQQHKQLELDTTPARSPQVGAICIAVQVKRNGATLPTPPPHTSDAQNITSFLFSELIVVDVTGGN